MKALVYTKPYQFEYRDFPDPVMAEQDVLIRVKACGICGSDVSGYTGKTGRRIPPLIMGHEAAGIVEQTGSQAGNIQKGDRVSFDSTVYCNRCEACRKRLYNRCEQRQVLGVSTPKFKRHGAFAERVAVPWWIVSKLPDNVTFAQATLLEPISIGKHAVNRTPISPFQTVVVIGAGTIGLCVLLAVKLKGVSKIIVSDIKDYRRELARELGADTVVNPCTDKLTEVVFKETEGKGADVTFEAVGLAETFQHASLVTRTGGHVTVVGLSQKEINLDVHALVARELTLSGTYASAGEFTEAINLIASGQINAEPLISRIMPLSRGQEAFDLLNKAEGDLVKIVLEP